MSNIQIAEVFERLRAYGAEKVVVKYDGAGDEGYVNEVIIEPEITPEVPEIEENLLKDCEEIIYQELPGGWEINEGSFGEAVFNVKEGTIAFDHNDRYESSEAHPFVVEGSVISAPEPFVVEEPATGLFSVNGESFTIAGDLVELRGPDWSQGETLASIEEATPDEFGKALANAIRNLAPRLIEGARDDNEEDGENYHPTFELNCILRPVKKEDQHG